MQDAFLEIRYISHSRDNNMMMNSTYSYRQVTKSSFARWFSNSIQVLNFKSKSTIKYNNRKKKLSASSSRWLKRQERDPYAKMAKKEGSPSRSIFKLEQIDQSLSKNRNQKNSPSLFRPGQTIIDLGVCLKIHTSTF